MSISELWFPSATEAGNNASESYFTLFQPGLAVQPCRMVSILFNTDSVTPSHHISLGSLDFAIPSLFNVKGKIGACIYEL